MIEIQRIYYNPGPIPRSNLPLPTTFRVDIEQIRKTITNFGQTEVIDWVGSCMFLLSPVDSVLCTNAVGPTVMLEAK